jgi:hypothetical protein
MKKRIHVLLTCLAALLVCFNTRAAHSLPFAPAPGKSPAVCIGCSKGPSFGGSGAQAHGMQPQDDNQGSSDCPDGKCSLRKGGGGGCPDGSCGARGGSGGGGCSSGGCGPGGGGGGGGGRGGGALGGMLKKAAPMALPLLMILLLNGDKDKDKPPTDLVGTPTPAPTPQVTATPSPHPTVCPSPTVTPEPTCDPFGPVIKPPPNPGTLPTPKSHSQSDPHSFFPGVEFGKM